MTIIFQIHFLDFFQISSRYLPEGQFGNMSALVRETVWHRTGDKLPFRPMMTQLNEEYVHRLVAINACVYLLQVTRYYF